MSAGYQFLAITPVGKPRMTRQDQWVGKNRPKRPAVQRYHDYCDALRGQIPGYELPVELHLTFYIEMPKSWSKKKRSSLDGKPHDSKPDIDNLAKAFMDAFKSEDKHVAKLHAEKYWALAGGIQVGKS